MDRDLEIELLNAISALMRALSICGPTAHHNDIRHAFAQAEAARQKSSTFRDAAVMD